MDIFQYKRACVFCFFFSFVGLTPSHRFALVLVRQRQALESEVAFNMYREFCRILDSQLWLQLISLLSQLTFTLAWKLADSQHRAYTPERYHSVNGGCDNHR